MDLKIAFQVTFFIKEAEEKLIRAKITRDLRAKRKLIMQTIISSQTFWMHLCALLQPRVHREEAVNDYLWPCVTPAWMHFIVKLLSSPSKSCDAKRKRGVVQSSSGVRKMCRQTNRRAGRWAGQQCGCSANSVMKKMKES